MRKTIRSLVLALAAAGGMSACVDVPTDLATAVGTRARLEYFDPAIEVDVVQRTTALAQDIKVSAVVGIKGGVIAIPQAGFQIEFHTGSLKVNTPITVTAVAGKNVIYLFEPHGLVFGTEPVITQDLKPTTAYADPMAGAYLEGAYFQDMTYVSGDKARIKETRPTMVDSKKSKMRWNLQHFSGYAATRRGGYISSSGTLLVP